MKTWTRRDVLVGGGATGAALFLIGCSEDEPGLPAVDAAPQQGGDAPPGTPDAAGPQLDATPQCEEGPTEDQILGPFYKEGAPERSVLVESGDAGVRLHLSG